MPKGRKNKKQTKPATTGIPGAALEQQSLPVGLEPVPPVPVGLQVDHGASKLPTEQPIPIRHQSIPSPPAFAQVGPQVSVSSAARGMSQLSLAQGLEQGRQPGICRRKWISWFFLFAKIAKHFR